MKKLYSLILALSLTAILAGQSPLSFKYQAVLRNLRGDVKTNTSSVIGIAIILGSTTGVTVYSENHNTTSDNYGLINLEIGKGSVTYGSMSEIDWGHGTYFIRITVDGVIMGTSQLLSVPYALYAEKAGNGFSGSYNDLKNKPMLFNGSWAALTGKPNFAAVATTGSYNDLTNKVSAGNGLNINGQNQFSLGFAGQSAGDIIYFDGANWIRLPKGTDGQVLTLKNGVPVWQTGSGSTNPAAPSITPPVVTDVTSNAVTLTTSVNPNGFMTEVEYEYGLTTDYEKGALDTDPPVLTGSLTTNVVASPDYLEENTTYHFRLVASSAVGITYSDDMTFTTTLANTNKFLFRDTTEANTGGNGFYALNLGYAMDDIQNTFTYDLWVKPTRSINMTGESNACSGDVSVPLAYSNQNWAIVPPAPALNMAVGLTIGTNGIMVGEHSGNILVSRLSYAVSISDWVHVAVVYRPDSLFLYFNGNLVRSRPRPCSSSNRFITAGLTGYYYSADFKGNIDEFRLWDIPLTRQEVKTVKDKKLMNQVSGLRYYAGFDNGTFERTLGDIGDASMAVTGLIPSKHIKTSSWDLVRYTGSTIGTLVPY